MNASTKWFCEVCDGTSHDARKMPNDTLECPARVIRIQREAGSCVPGSDPATVAPVSQDARALVVIGAVYEALSDSKDGIPAGTLYALLMSHGCTMEQFDAMIGTMERVGMVTREGHLLRAVAPKGGK